MTFRALRSRWDRLQKRRPGIGPLPADPAALLALAREKAAYYGAFLPGDEPTAAAGWAGLVAELDANDLAAARLFLCDVADVEGAGR